METLEDEAVPDALLDWLEEHVSVPCGPISAPREDADDDASRFKLQVPHEVQAADDGSKDWAVAAAASRRRRRRCRCARHQSARTAPMRPAASR